MNISKMLLYLRGYTLLAHQEEDAGSLKMKGEIFLVEFKKDLGVYKSEEERQFLKKLFKKESPRWSAQEIEDFYRNKDRYRLRKIEFVLYDTGLLLLGSQEDDTDIKTAYFVIKFLFHRDRFHKRSAENIVPILRLDDDTDSVDKDALTRNVWRHMVKYVSEQRKNSQSPVILSELMGVLGYIESFITIMEHKGFCKKETAQELKDYMANLAQSLKIELEKKPPRNPTLYQFLEDFRLVAFVTVLIMAVFKFYEFLKINKTKENPSQSILAETANYLPDTALGFLTFIFVVTFLLTLLFQLLHNKSLRGTYIENLFIRRWADAVHFVKKHSKPNSAPWYRISQKYLFPALIKAEMFFRRNLKWIYKALILALITAVFFFGTLYLVTTYSPSITDDSDPKSDPLSIAADENDTK
jgi:hypothetical protein